jgi:ribosomal protein L10
MAKYTSNRQRKLKVGITSYTENLTVLEVTGGAYISSSVGIGTTNPSQTLHIQGNARITGAVYDSTNLSGISGQVLQSTVTGTQWVNTSNIGIATYATLAGIATYATSAGIATYATNAGIATYATNAGISTNVIGGIASVTSLSVSGISTLGTVKISSGIITATVGVVTYYGDGSKLTNVIATSIVGIASYATLAGIATYATNAGIATYATNSGIATYSTNAGIATYSTNAGIATYATNSGIATYATNAGIATYATNAGISTNVIGGIASVTSLSVSGISTLGTVQVSSGIITATVGVVTYYGDGSKLTDVRASSIIGGIGYVDIAGIATNVIGGIASVTSLSVSGISTLGTVKISSGIITATVGVVTYYGDGSKLTGIQTSGVVSVISQDPTVSSPVYPTLVNNIGVSSLGIYTSKLSFIPSTNKLGIGTGLPRENLDVTGTIGIQSSGSSNRFYLQHNTSQSSIDFIFV